MTRTPPCRPANCGLFVVCDGHNGVAAAQYVADQLPAYLDDLLPLGEPPDEADAKAFLTWRQGLQRALTISLALLHRAFAGQGMLAGCTVTIVLQVSLQQWPAAAVSTTSKASNCDAYTVCSCKVSSQTAKHGQKHTNCCSQHGWLLTCANLGDSRAIVDTGREVTVLTDDHRVATHRLERRRLERKGATIAPVDINGGNPVAVVMSLMYCFHLHQHSHHGHVKHCSKATSMCEWSP
jgi:serine/threonine protein phosphatase PrpC